MHRQQRHWGAGHIAQSLVDLRHRRGQRRAWCYWRL